MIAGLLGKAGPAAAEELAGLWGVTHADADDSKSYAWSFAYAQRLAAHLDASFTYLNEGHVPGHHRDGAALQLWGTQSFWHERLTLALGAGPYVYCDTTADYLSEPFYHDEHGVGAIVTGSARYGIFGSWSALLELTAISVPGSVNSRLLLVGASYRFKTESDPDLGNGGASNQVWRDTRNEAGFVVGQSIMNAVGSDRSTNFGLEYRRRVTRHIDMESELLSERNSPDGRRLDLAMGSSVVQDFLERRFSIGLGVGADVALGSYHTPDGRKGAPLVGFLSMTGAWRLTSALGLRLSWRRGVTEDDQDRDIVTAGFNVLF